MLANKQRKENVALVGYYEVTHTPGLWKQVLHPTLVDDFVINMWVRNMLNI